MLVHFYFPMQKKECPNQERLSQLLYLHHHIFLIKCLKHFGAGPKQAIINEKIIGN